MRTPRPVLVLLLLLALSLGCGEYEQATKQTPTFANLQNIAREIQRRVEAGGEVTAQDATAFMERYNGGRDEWGNRFDFASREEPEYSFIVVSPGSDHALDIPDVGAYFEMKECNIVGQFSKDIVFRDGRHVTVASPK